MLRSVGTAAGMDVSVLRTAEIIFPSVMESTIESFYGKDWNNLHTIVWSRDDREEVVRMEFISSYDAPPIGTHTPLFE